ncbi:ABC transporter [Desulfosporosinus sp. OT]|uniref:fluoroquinolone export ABC transporter permease subunit n=1 Tax=Desulfosporosinus sp. OT TaxID=913865 RepID=UPI000223A44A|nr:ABC transporter [Desulfosporosinus sp. OT]EGW39194.1 ABC-2 type transporter family protein [Desulfosporosinus sp. OT]
MRLIAALKSDLKFQFKHGFYTVYTLIAVLYIIILQKIPGGLFKDYTLALIVFSDPAMLGFFFIGGIVMLEKQQGILDYLAVTPLSPQEYITSKVVTLALLSVSASVVIALMTHLSGVNWLLLTISILALSVFFTLYGFMVTLGCRTINQYFFKTVPFLLLTTMPCFAIFIFPHLWIVSLLPNVAGLKLTLGLFLGLPWQESLLYLLILGLWDIVIYKLSLKVHSSS